MRITLRTLGCRLNEAELETWTHQFQAAGHRIVADTEAADLVVINSCAVTQDAVRKSRHLIRKLKRENPAAKLIVSGCYVTLNPDEAANALGVDQVVANADKGRLVAIASELGFDASPATPTDPDQAAVFSHGRQRAFIKVQDGCRYRCTFCIVTIARGEESSRPEDEIIEEIRTLQRQGVQEAVLTGVHLGGYGSDINSALERLIRRILAETEIPRLRLGSLEPWELPEGFFELFQNPRLMPHLHLPLQSGSDSVLRRMARRCHSGEFRSLVERLRAQVEDINISTDIIAGFPGETHQEWEQSLAFIESIGFGHLHIFTYSRREGTKAARLPDQVPSAEKKERSRILHQLDRRLRQETLARHIGREFPVLWEGNEAAAPEAPLFGYTPNYLRVAILRGRGESPVNRILRARLENLDPSSEFLTARLL